MKNTGSTTMFEVMPIGMITSILTNLKDCPLQEAEGAPEAYIEFYSAYADGIKDIQTGDKIIILTWLHLADREVRQCYRRNDVGSREYGVFSTRSPDRPNPIGFHVATVSEVLNEKTIRIYPIEVINGTPVLDIKPF
jgi:tRNA-Thr(GGU) m(6)t(6)A37 methyltransferase TsaA